MTLAKADAKRGRPKVVDAKGEGMGGASFRTITPGDCLNTDPLQPCYCYRQESIRLIAAELTECEAVRFELEQYMRLADIKDVAPWYEDPNFMLGGVVVSFALGGVIGYWLTNVK